MKEIFWTHNRPWTIYEMVVFLVLWIIVTTTLIWSYRRKKLVISQVIACELLVCFMAVVLGSTVFTRISNGMYNYELLLFWSWREVFAGNRLMLEEIVLNIILLVPAGVLLPWVFCKKIAWYKAFLIGMMVSAFIEVSQLLLCRGLFEWDDILHNALGMMVGCSLANPIFGRIKNK